jgi:predicted RNA polymerase sigma factor
VPVTRPNGRCTRSGRVLATLIHVTGDIDLAEDASRELDGAARSAQRLARLGQRFERVAVCLVSPRSGRGQVRDHQPRS